MMNENENIVSIAVSMLKNRLRKMLSLYERAKRLSSLRKILSFTLYLSLFKTLYRPS